MSATLLSPRSLALVAAAVLAPVVAPVVALAERPQAAPRAGAPIVLAPPADFAAAVAALESATGAKAEKLPFGDVPLGEGRSFAVAPGIAEALLAGSHAPYRKAGLYLFRYERSFGMAGEKDRIGLLRTADHRVVVKRVGTGHAQRGVTTEKILAWLDALEKEEPFELWEVGADYLAGRFEKVPKDPAATARRCAELAPDLVAGRASTLDLLAGEIRTNRTLYLIW